MFSKVRCRYVPRRGSLIFQFRHFSYLDSKDGSGSSPSGKPRNGQTQDRAKAEEWKSPMPNNGSRFSVAVSSFLNSSLSSLEDYIANQAPIKSSQQSEGYNTELLEIDMDNDATPQKSIGNIPYQLGEINKGFKEFIDLSNPDHIRGLLAINRERWIKNSPEISQAIDKTCNVDIPLILNFYLRSLAEIRRQLQDPSMNTKVGMTSQRHIISLLLNLQWFRSASFIILEMKLPFNDLVNYLNDLLEDELIFQKSDWMRYLFIINFYQLYKNVNPLVLTNLDFLGRPQYMDRFKILNMMWRTHYTTKQELKTDVSEWYEMCGHDIPVSLMHIYKSVDIIKYNNPFNLAGQVNELKTLIGASSSSLMLQKNFLASFLKHLVSASDFELQYSQSPQCNLSKKEVRDFLTKRKNAIINFVVLSKKLQTKSFDCLTVLELRPPPAVGLQLWDYHISGMNNSLSSTIYYKFLVSYFVSQLTKTSKINEIVKVEFSNLSSARKTNLITTSLISYLKSSDTLTRNRVGGYIALTNQQREHSHVMKNAIQKIFSKHENYKFNYSDLLKVFELVSSFSPTLSNKEGLFEIGNQIIEANHGNADFFPFNAQEKFTKTIEFIDLLKSIDPESKIYVTRLVPSIINFYHEFILSADDCAIDFTKMPEVKQLCYILNKTFDVACRNPRELTLLNPKNYASKIYITNQGLLQKVSSKLFQLPKNVLFFILQSRATWICADQEDWISKFHKAVFTFGIFLEVLVRRSTRESYEGNINFSELNDVQFAKALKDEMDTISSNETVWECVEMLSGFEWNEEVSDVFFRGKSIHSGETEPEIGFGIIMVLTEVRKLNGTVYSKRCEAIEGLMQKDTGNNEVESFDDVTDALFDSNGDSPHEDDHLLDTTKHSDSERDNEQETNVTVSRGLLDQDLLEFNELYRNMKNYEQFVPHRNKGTGSEEQSVTIAKLSKSVPSNKVKKRYTVREKERLVRFYSPLRLKGMLIESLIMRNPKLIDAIVRRLYVEYETRIPVSLLHSAMLGIIKSEQREVGFIEKINVIKVLDTLASLIYSTASHKVHSYLFMNCVRFREFRIELVDMIIEESKRSNSGSLKTLNWAVNKITNTPNMIQYKNEFARWTNDLNNMKEMKVGFWNPGNTGKWIKDDI